jgi:pimeloyl-ACP methyl ester carboxylesterase
MPPSVPARVMRMTLVSERVGQFFFDDHRLEFTEYGGGDAWVVLLPAPLMPRRMHQPLARRLAAAGNHVVTLDPLGHGRSDKPADPSAYSTTAFAEEVLGLLDHLGAERAVVGGPSLGANIALEVADLAPKRVAGLLLEMPLLDNAVEAGILAYTPLLVTARYAPAAVRAVRAASGVVPRGIVPFWAGIGLDTLHQRPESVAAAVHGVFFGRIAPPAPRRRAIDAPALVVGVRHDPVHAIADAEMVAAEIPDSVYVEASGIWEWRVSPARLDAEAIALCERAASQEHAPARLRRT